MVNPQEGMVRSTFTVLSIFYLCVLLYNVSSTAYSPGYWGTEPFSFFSGLVTGVEEIGHMERSPTAWRPYLWLIKSINLGKFLDAFAMPVGTEPKMLRVGESV
jgi:hypothetical protein